MAGHAWVGIDIHSSESVTGSISGSKRLKPIGIPELHHSVSTSTSNCSNLNTSSTFNGKAH